uniref:Uncharacterized protein n=1 Tax=Timema cristinae TaxID=61476 RepID=A0A7R9DQM8_TIMCR|nr:unnamed protein product [Timema cristinae]
MEQPSRSSALTLETKVLAALRFFAGGSYQTSVGQDSNLCIHQSSVSRAITEVSNAINTHLFDQWVRLDLTPASLATLRQG